jgi:hypothetical protein
LLTSSVYDVILIFLRAKGMKKESNEEITVRQEREGKDRTRERERMSRIYLTEYSIQVRLMFVGNSPIML